jgi:hypothetical protein
VNSQISPSPTCPQGDFYLKLMQIAHTANPSLSVKWVLTSADQNIFFEVFFLSKRNCTSNKNMLQKVAYPFGQLPNNYLTPPPLTTSPTGLRATVTTARTTTRGSTPTTPPSGGQVNSQTTTRAQVISQTTAGAGVTSQGAGGGGGGTATTAGGGQGSTTTARSTTTTPANGQAIPSSTQTNNAETTFAISPGEFVETTTPSSSGGLSSGAIAGIVVGSLVGAALIAALLIVAVRAGKKGASPVEERVQMV